MATAVQNALKRLRKAKKNLCAGRGTKTQVSKAASAYVKAANSSATKKIKDSKKLAKRKKEIKSIANKIKKAGCSMSPRVSGTKKRKTTRRKKK